MRKQSASALQIGTKRDRNRCHEWAAKAPHPVQNAAASSASLKIFTKPSPAKEADAMMSDDVRQKMDKQIKPATKSERLAGAAQSGAWTRPESRIGTYVKFR